MLSVLCRSSWVLLVASCSAGCGASKQPVATGSSVPPHAARIYPEWVNGLEPHLDNIKACLADKLPPSGIVYLKPLPQGATGVTTIDGQGDTRHCSARRGEVFDQEDSARSARDFHNLAVFTPGPERPVVRELALVEEVIDEEQRAIGFVYWPDDLVSQASAESAVMEDQATEEHADGAL